MSTKYNKKWGFLIATMTLTPLWTIVCKRRLRLSRQKERRETFRLRLRAKQVYETWQCRHVNCVSRLKKQESCYCCSFMWMFLTGYYDTRHCLRETENHKGGLHCCQDGRSKTWIWRIMVSEGDRQIIWASHSSLPSPVVSVKFSNNNNERRIKQERRRQERGKV